MQGDGIDPAAHSQLLLVTQKGLQPNAATGEAGEEQGKKQRWGGGEGSDGGEEERVPGSSVGIGDRGVSGVGGGADQQQQRCDGGEQQQRCILRCCHAAHGGCGLEGAQSEQARGRLAGQHRCQSLGCACHWYVCYMRDHNFMFPEFFYIGSGAVSSLVISVVSRGDGGGLVRFLRVGGEQAKLFACYKELRSNF